MLTKHVADTVTQRTTSYVFDNPKDFGLEYEDVTFKASDGVTLSGWLVKGSADIVKVSPHRMSDFPDRRLRWYILL